MDVKVGLWRKLSAEELMLLNCGVGEDSWESLGLQGDPTSPFWRRSVLGVHWKELMLKLKLQYFGHLMWRVDSLEKTLMLGGIGGRKRRGQQRMRWLDGITYSMDLSLSKLREWTANSMHFTLILLVDIRTCVCKMNIFLEFNFYAFWPSGHKLKT